MKTTRSLLVLMVVMSLMACGSQLHVVTLYVDTTQIDSTSIDQHASFGQPVGIANEDFTTVVRKGDKIIWWGQSISNPEHIVKITSIEHKDGEKIFKPKPFRVIKRKGDPVYIKGSDELVRGKVRLGPGKEEAYIEEKYNLYFSVTNKGTFQIDPVIKGHH